MCSCAPVQEVKSRLDRRIKVIHGVAVLQRETTQLEMFFHRKEVFVYPDDDNKHEVGEGLDKKAEITLDCVWLRDKSIGTTIKSPEKLKAIRWQDKIGENSLKVSAKFIDYRSETGSCVFEVKYFSKYSLVDDLDEEDVPEKDKKRLPVRLAQQQQMAVQRASFQ
ncbi:nuclear pore complex protein Nup98-Nup96-like [Mercenaria mercenaria]|uniref:nuclear pore complex protein Nup98-Nup96-like n=1 Tax=Mercenaria mercenaria TaxID=6596 RepID=UPI00234EE855|nr:nuclear pore complex protein Nup98-Nup96-like [Mercenaria mercenaria]